MKELVRSEENLATKNVEDFTVLANGDAFISIRKLGDLIDVPKSTLHRYCGTLKIDTGQGISYKHVSKVGQHYAEQGNIAAIKFIGMLSEAGAKAFIYHYAGYKMQAVPGTFAEALQLAADQQRLIEEQQKQIEFDRPKVEFHDMVISENPIISMNEFAKELTKQYMVKIGQNKMMAFLREKKILMNGRDRTERNKPYQKYMNLGWFECEYVTTPVGLVVQTFITGEGQVKLARLIIEHFKGVKC